MFALSAAGAAWAADPASAPPARVVSGELTRVDLGRRSVWVKSDARDGTKAESRETRELDAAIGPDTRLVDCVVARDCTVQNTVGLESEVGAGAVVGPFAHLPSGSSVAPAANTGAFYTAPVG